MRRYCQRMFARHVAPGRETSPFVDQRYLSTLSAGSLSDTKISSGCTVPRSTGPGVASETWSKDYESERYGNRVLNNLQHHNIVPFFSETANLGNKATGPE